MDSSNQRPRIGVTGPGKRWAPGRIASCRAVRRAGGVPIAMRPSGNAPLSACNGFVITGGSDLHPELYGASPELFSPPDRERDRFELSVLDFAQERNLPVLGICRGAQLLNVHRGGTLFSDITKMRALTSNRGTILPRKKVRLSSGTRLSSVLRRETLSVNSLHHQAVDRVGEGLAVVARDGDNIVQGIEFTEERWVIGVQWHPEYLTWLAPHRRLFSALVAAAV
ncbi:MAG: gamma-glutamyl-gamma-aminobutyrate hydrolase family protein [Pseudomonadota bacterium]